MAMKLIEKIREATGLKNYGIAKSLRALDIEATSQGIDAYEEETARSMRLAVLCRLMEICENHGIPESTFIGWLREEFGSNPKSKKSKGK